MPHDPTALLKSTPLPSTLHFSEPEVEPDSSHRDAYSLAADLAQIPAWPTTRLEGDKLWPERLPPPLASRILGYLLAEAPVQNAADIIAREINACCPKDSLRLRSDNVLYELADLARFYALALLKPCTDTYSATLLFELNVMVSQRP